MSFAVDHFLHYSIQSFHRCSLAWLQYNLHVVIQSIREFNRAVPFVPYQIRMASGERYEVPHPDFALISPRGSFVIVVDQDERPHHLSSLLIESASQRNGTRRRRRS
jgi:hypothetical protein